MVAIKVNNLSKVYRTYQRKEGLFAAFTSLFNRKFTEKKAVSDVNFEINEGEIVGFIGPNGAGKSSVIKMMTGILVPTAGSVNVLGYVPFEERQKYVQNIGVVFGQKSQLWWDLPPIDVFDLLKDIYMVPEKEYKVRINYMIKLLKLEKVVQTQVRNLSLGERMRCELIAALLHNPRVVFLDEPTIGLDIVAKEYIRAFIKGVNRKYKTTFIVTTHDMDDIEDLCKRVIVIDEGRLIYDGLLENIKKKYLKSKVVNAVLDIPSRKTFNMNGTKIIHRDNYTISVKVDLEKQNVSDVVAKLIKQYKVVDLKIDELDIKDIIKKIYGK